MDSQTRKQTALWTMICGVLSAVFYLLHDLIGSMYYPGYDRMTQAVSDLTAADAPSFAVASGYSCVYGILSCVCCAFLCLLSKGEGKILKSGIILFTAMNAVSAVGYSLFPLSSAGFDGSAQSFVHVYIVTVLVVLLSIVSLILISIGSFRAKRKVVGILALFALICMFFGAAGSNLLPKSVFGIVERLSTYSAVLFTAVLGISAFFGSAGEKENSGRNAA